MSESENFGGGSGTASDAQIIASDDMAVVDAADLGEVDEATAAAKKAYETLKTDAEAAVAAAQAKVSKQQAHLDGAKQSLESAEAALAEFLS